MDNTRQGTNIDALHKKLTIHIGEYGEISLTQDDKNRLDN